MTRCGSELVETALFGGPFIATCELDSGHAADHVSGSFTWGEHSFSEQLTHDENNALCQELTGKTADELIWEEDWND
jgi:hypothetical protein